MSANRIKALVKQVRGKDGVTPAQLRNIKTLIALSMLLDAGTWDGMDVSLRDKLVKTQLLPLLVELNACMWQAIGEFYDADVNVETEVAFNKVRCKLSELQKTDIGDLLAAIA
ncbi:hypothetical protein IKF76_00370 [Candidatus Saccharibacteria bacterium]|nr:hypothetical protein [Candidatus Saccharibacteria bacterium]